MRHRYGTRVRGLFSVFVFLVLLAAVACTAQERELPEGLLQNFDAVNGKITIVTKDGETFRLTLVTEVREPLEPGDFIEVELDEDDRVIALDNKSRQAAQEFVQDCNDDGKVDLSYNLKIEGGESSLTRACQVSLGDGRKLEIIKATIEGTTSLEIEGRSKAELIIDEATIDVGAGGLLFISGDESVVVVSKSTLVGSPVDIEAASSGSKGQMQVSDSTIRSPNLDIILTASEHGREGQMQVSDSVFAATGNIRIATGEKGQTQVSKIEFDVGNTATIQAGPEGQCQSQDNTPAILCIR